MCVSCRVCRQRYVRLWSTDDSFHESKPTAVVLISTKDVPKMNEIKHDGTGFYMVPK